MERRSGISKYSLMDAQASSAKAKAAEQIAVEAGRLGRLATEHAFPLLAYLIDMVVLEAWREASEAEAADRAGESGGSARAI